MYSNPPDPNNPTIDHGLDEEFIWAFGRTMMNQYKVNNLWMQPGSRADTFSFAPYWGQKLGMPAWYKREKIEKFNRHW